MQSCLCTCKQSSFHWAFPWYFLYVPRIFSMYCLVTPSIGLHQSFPLFLGWWFPLPFLYPPPYASNICPNVTCARPAPVTFFEVVLAPYFSLYCSDVLLFFLMVSIFVLDIVPTALSICLMFSIMFLQCSRTALGDCSSFSYIFHYYSLLTGDWSCHGPCGETC